MERETATKFIHELLDLLVKQKGSDLFITAGFPPALKIDGKIAPVSKTVLTSQHTIELVRSVMNDKQAMEFESTKECNFAIAPPGIGRFRINAFVQQGRVRPSPPAASGHGAARSGDRGRHLAVVARPPVRPPAPRLDCSRRWRRC